MAASPYRHTGTIGLLEVASIATGIEVTDRVLKEATVEVPFARPVSPGKYVLLFSGSVDDVRSSLRVGAEVAGDHLIDRLFLAAVHDDVLAALTRPVEAPELDAVGVIETFTVASTLRAADAAAKEAAVTLIEVRLASGIGGKSYVTMTGEVSDVEDATLAGASGAEEAGLLLRRVVIPRPHEALREILSRHDEAI
ncbi:MAG: BMC domain-containing protein [Planctomycetota bacterium JB042]